MKSGELFYVSKGRYIPLSEWSYFFLGLGEDVAKARNLERCLVVAAALPTRAYVAALTALGIVRTFLSEPLSEKDLDEVWRKTKVGTPVIVQDGTGRVRGKFGGLSRFPPDKRLRIGVLFPNRKGNPSRWFLPEHCSIIPLASGATMVLPEQNQMNEILKNPKGRVPRAVHVGECKRGNSQFV